MTSADLAKLTKAGFRVFYQDIIKKVIYESLYGVRLVHGRYKSKAEMDRAWFLLMKSPWNISR